MPSFEEHVLLIVDDDQELQVLLAEVGRRAGYRVLLADSGACLKEQLAQHPVSLVLLDLQMMDMDGVEALRHMASVGCQADVMLVSGMGHKVLSTARQIGLSMGLRMQEIMQKPVRVAVLEQVLLQHRGLHAPLTRDEFQRALAEYELTLHYQPIMRRSDDMLNISAVEALVRWQHPTRGLLFPGEFLPLVERENLVTELTDFVLTESLRQVGHWHARGIHVGLSVNLAARTVRDLHFPDRLASVLKEYDVAPGSLCFEVTEAAAVGDPQVVLDSFARLRVKGVQLALDDFGVGTSSLTQLYRMPYNCMKIDRALIAEMSHSQQACTVVSALVELGHKLSLQVCAEGVETEAACNQLERMDCDFLQGNYLSVPLPALALEQFVRQWQEHHQASHRLTG